MCQDLVWTSLILFAKMKRKNLARGVYLFFFILPEPLALWGLAFRSHFSLCFRHVVLSPSLLGVLFFPEHFRLHFHDFFWPLAFGGLRSFWNTFIYASVLFFSP
jgi:hypothetical protein